MKMASKEKKPSHGHTTNDDRISNLPECILHDILSLLDTKEACRTSILSKGWATVWNSFPFLDFQVNYFFKGNSQDPEIYDKGSVDRYVDFIDRTMNRYSQQNLPVRRLKLELPMLDPKLACLTDSWVQIAVSNGIEELDLSVLSKDSPSYRLPEILFNAKSLRILRCECVELPYYQVMKLISLQSLHLYAGYADENMLHHIISSCPLIYLAVDRCRGLANVLIPKFSKIEELRVVLGNVNVNINQETGCLRTFVYHALFLMWACKINAGALRNLKKLDIHFARISDEVFRNLLSELPLVETLGLYRCFRLRNLKLSSNQLKELRLVECEELKDVVIDAPNLAYFYYDGDEGVSLSLINIQPQCDAFFFINAIDVDDVSWFVKLRRFLFQSKICKVLSLVLPGDVLMNNLMVDKLSSIRVVQPHELRELMLSRTCYSMATLSSLSAFFDGLFWVCHPAALSISSSLDLDKFVKMLLEVLEDKVKCRKHPLTGIQVDSIGCSSMTMYEEAGGSDVKFYIRLCW